MGAHQLLSPTGTHIRPVQGTPDGVWGTHQGALQVEGVGEDHVGLPVLHLEEAGALGGAAILCGGLFPRGRGLEARREVGIRQGLGGTEGWSLPGLGGIALSGIFPEPPTVCT